MKMFSRVNPVRIALVLALTIAFGAVLVSTPATAATNNYINFQARLLNASGSLVLDGNYNVSFHIFNVQSGSSGSTDTSCGTDANCLWSETYTVAGSNAVRVAGGYMSVQLGSSTAFPSTIPWDQQLYLTMDIGGTGSSPAWDGQMLNSGSRLPLTGVPYSFKAGAAFQIQNSSYTTLVTTSGNQVSLPQATSSSGALTFGGDTTADLYRSTSGTLKTDGSLIVNSQLGIGTTSLQAGAAITMTNGSWLSSTDAAGSGFINLFSVNSSNQIQAGAAIAVDGGLVLPTDAGQVTIADLPIDSSASTGTKESYTFRVGSSNALTVYGEADGSGNAQNIRVAVGSSITPAYTLDVGGDVNILSTSAYRIGGTAICTSAGCTAASGSGYYVQLQSSTPGTAQTGNFNISGVGIAGTLNASTAIQTGGTTRIDSGGNLSNIGTYSGSGNITTTGGVLSIQGTGTNTFSGSLSVAGNETLTGTFQQNNTYSTYRWKTAGGTDTNWKTIANISAGTSTYTGVSFEVDVVDSGGNWGQVVSESPMRFFVSIQRTDGGALDDLDTAQVSGPSVNYVQVVKTSNSTYELQVRQPTTYQYVTFTAQVTSQNDTTITYVTSPANGSVGTAYTAAATHTDYFTNLSAAGNLTVRGSNIYVGNGSAATISTPSGNANLTLQANGTGTLLLDSGGAGTVTIGTNAANIDIGNGTGADTVNIATNSGADIVNVGSATTGDTVNVYGNSTFQSVTDNSSSFAVKNSGGTAVLAADTQNLAINVTNLQASGTISLQGADGGSILLRTAANSGTGTSAMSFSGYEITDSGTGSANSISLSRTAGLQGDGRTPSDSSTGIWESTTNLITNGGFETNDTNYWSTYGTASHTRVTTTAKFGSASDQVTAPSGYGIFGTQNLTASTTYTFSAWVKLVSGSGSWSLLKLKHSDGTDASSTTFTPTTTWQRYTFTFTPAATTTYETRVQFGGSGTGVILVDGVQFEQKAIATPYVETNGATAARSAAGISAPSSNLNSTTGWVAARLRLGFSFPYPGTNWPGVFDWGGNDTNSIQGYFNPSSNNVGLRRTATGGTGTNSILTSMSGYTAGQAVTLIFAWTSNQLAISVNGGNFVTATPDPSQTPTIAATTFGIGVRNAAAGNEVDSDVFWTAAGTGTLTNTDAANIYKLGNSDPTITGLNALVTSSSSTFAWDGEGTQYSGTNNDAVLQSGISIDDVNLYHSANGSLALQGSTNSTTALQVLNTSGTTVLDVDTANNRVGIGTNAPQTDLQISGSAGIRLAGTGTNNDTIDIVPGVAGTYDRLDFKADTSGRGAAFQLQPATSSTTSKISLTNANDSSNFGSLFFDVENTAANISPQLVGTGSAVTSLSFGGGSGAGAWTSVLFSSGNVGINEASGTPGAKLEVKASSTTSAGGIKLLSSTTSNAIVNIQDGGSDSGLVSINSAGSAKIGLNSNGNSYFTGGSLGVGTTTPYQLLDVQNNTSGGNAFVHVGGGGGAGQSGIQLGNTAGSSFGTLYWDNSTNNLILQQKYTSGSLLLGTNSTTRLTIDNSGNATLTGNLTVTGGATTFNNATSNILYYGTPGAAAPGAGSIGEKIQLYGTAGSIAATDYGLGVESSNLWLNTNGGIKFYKAAVLQAAIDSSGNINSQTGGIQTAGVTRIDNSGNFSGGTVNTDTLDATHLTFSGADDIISSAVGNTNSNMTLQANGTGTLLLDSNSTSGIVSLGLTAGTVNIANSASATTIGIGNTTGGTGITERVGTGNYSLDGVAGSTYAIGASAVGGTITLGGTGQTGNINIGQATTVSQTVNIATTNGTASTQTVSIAGGTSTTSGGKVVQIATGTPGTGTTNTVSIGTGGATTGTVAVSIGSNGAAAHTTTIQGGNGTTAVTVQAATGGTIVIGSQTASTNNNVTIGVAGSTANTDNININNSTGANTGVITLGGTGSSGQITLGQATTVSQTVSIESSNGTAATQTVTIAGGSSTTSGGKVVNIATGTPGSGTTNTVHIGDGGSTTGTVAITVGSNSAANHTLVLQGGNVNTAGSEAIRIQTAAAGGIAIGTAAQTGTITLGQATTASTQIVNIESANGTASTQTINIGAGSSTTSGGKVVNIATGTPGSGTTNTVHIGDGGSTTGTVAVTIGSNTAAGHSTTIQGGNGSGAITLNANGGGNTGTIVKTVNNSTLAFQIQNNSSQALFVADTSNQRVSIGAGAAPATAALTIGTNTTTAAGGVIFGTDTSADLYRSGPGMLTMDGALTVAVSVTTPLIKTASGNLQIQPATGLTQFNTASVDNEIRVYGSGGSNYATLSYNNASSSGILSVNTGTIKVGSGSGPINILAGSGASITITANAASTWQTTAGTLTLQAGSGLILNSATTATHDVTINDTSTTALQIQNASASNIFVADTTNMQLLVGNTNPNSSTSVSYSTGSQTRITYVTTGTIPVSSSGRTDEVIASDGFARIAYYDSSTDYITFVQCLNRDCDAHNITQITTTGTYNYQPRVIMGNDGYARLVFIKSGHLTYVQCTNASCSTNVLTTVESSGTLYSNVSMTLGSDGYARIAYADNSHHLKYAQCTNDACTTANLNVVDATSTVGATSVQLGSDGYARIAYNMSVGNLEYAVCVDAACASAATINIVDSASGAGDFGISLVLDSSGFARIAYQNWSSGAIRYAQCTNSTCSTGTNLTTIDALTGGSGAPQPSIVLNASGNAQIAYSDTVNDHLNYVLCGNSACSSGNTTTVVDSSPGVGGGPSIAKDSNANLYFSYTDYVQNYLKFANISAVKTGASASGVNIGANTGTFANVYVANLQGSFATIKPTSDTTSVFQVQNSSGTNLFVVDTANNQIVLGAASASPVVLVLGNRNVTGDPVCTSGGLYYNSSSNFFRGCQNGSWGSLAVGDQTTEYAMPIPGAGTLTSASFSSNTTAWFHMFNQSNPITIKTVTVRVPGVTTNGTLAFAIYNAATQQQVASWTYASSGAGAKIMTLSSPVYLPPGSYYFGMVTVGTTSLSLNIWGNPGIVDTGSGLEEYGSLTVTAGTLPTTLDGSTITFNAGHILMVRFN